MPKQANVNYDLRRLAPHECLLLWRRKAGITQARMARKHGCGLNAYVEMEGGGRIVPAEWYGFMIPKMKDLCLLARRRLGWTQPRAQLDFIKWSGLAKHRRAADGVSRMMYASLELEGAEVIVNFYKNKGFTFN